LSGFAENVNCYTGPFRVKLLTCPAR
jgi:hypothetical protein